MTKPTEPTEFRSPVGPQVIFAMDLQGQCTLSVGPGLEAQGLRPGELVGQNLFAVYGAPEDADTLKRALSGESFTTQRALGGRLISTFFHPMQAPDGSLTGSMGVMTDVTETVREAEELTRFKALADESQDLVAISDEAGRLDYVNPQISAMRLRPSPDDLWSTIRTMVGERLLAEVRARLESGGRWSGNVTLRLQGREVVFSAQVFVLFHADGRRLGTALVARDVTELHASEEALRATNADLVQFQALVETSRDFIAIAGLEGDVRYVNPAGRELVGLPADVDVRTTTIRDYLTPEGIKRSERFEQPAVIEHGHWEGISTLRLAEGPPIPVEIASFLMYDTDTQQPFALATVQRDITERLAVQTAHEEFVVLVAHELRTPLTSVKGYVEIAMGAIDEAVDPGRVSGHLQVVARNVARMERLVGQILRIAGERSAQPASRRPRDIVQIVQQAAESAGPAVDQAGIQLLLAPAPPLMLDLDDEFAEVVDNLISNAVKYTPTQGQVDVAVFREADEAVLCISDTGPGVPLSERERVFDKFSRGENLADQTIPGLGLGLFITRAIVQSHDGEITVEDRPGGGTRFVVRLPIPPDDSSM